VIDEDEVLDLHLQGMSPRQIALRVGSTMTTVDSAIKRMRIRYGEEVVPYIDHTGAKRYPMQDAPGILTWAGAFKLLARHMRDKGDAEGYAYAQELAKQKQMNL
jgi:hypothetical protein